MIWLYTAGVVVFLVLAAGIAGLLVVSHAADGYERLMESEGGAG